MRILALVLVLALLAPMVAAAEAKHIAVLSVSEDNETIGRVADIYLDVRPGRGAVFIDSFPLTRLDTQISTRLAKEYACSLSDVDCSELDFFYVIRSPSTIIGGPSAGAAITVMTYAALEELPLDESVVMTGTINSGGIVGPVGGVPGKIRAAAAGGFDRVLIPRLENEVPANDVIDVIPIIDVEEAIWYFTGVDVREEVPDVVVPPPEYVVRMAGVAESLCGRAYQLEESLSNVSNDTRTMLSNAATASAKQQYYSAASFCFGASLRLQEQVLEDKSPLQLRLIIRQLSEDIEDLDAASQEGIDTFADLEIFMIVRERLLEAHEMLEGLEDENVSTQDLAYAIERFNSARSWNTFVDAIPSEQYDFTQEFLASRCTAKLAEAEERLNYVQYVIGSPLADSAKGVRNAREDERQEEYALCIFKALKAKAEANSVLSVLYQPESLNRSVTIKLDKADELIRRETAKGNFPILAYSYAEYARELDDLYSANLYAEYALELGALEAYFPEEAIRPRVDLDRLWILLVGLLVGFLAGALAREVHCRHAHSKAKKRRKR